MNRLKGQISPYLQQHSDNPVYWQPWDIHALKEAKDRDIPIFLSVGYSTCHWCHVMERESFSDQQTAEILNDSFVCIKVDREEMPHIDNLYMEFCHLITGSGGWPLTIVMTPNLYPFFAATYLPKHTTMGRKGLIDIAQQINRLWIEQRAEIESLSLKIFEALRANIQEAAKPCPLEMNTLPHRAFHHLSSIYDSQNGGFGSAPKFPMPTYLLFFIAYYRAYGSKEALQKITHSLESMGAGGIYDIVEKGFHRYATDQKWSIPHFEKMLYDQAMLIRTYTEAYEITRSDFFRDRAIETIGYVLEELTSPEGIFYTAEDADSEGSEGLYYTWTLKELKDSLNNEEMSLMLNLFDLSEEGNFEETGRNILYCKQGSNAILNVAIKGQLDRILNKLRLLRSNRIRPFKDRKSLTGCNGLMIYALAKASATFHRKDFLEAALRALNFIKDKIYNPDSGLYRVYYEGQTRTDALLEDYAFLIAAALQTDKAATGNQHLRWALALTDYVLGHFYDSKGKGFYSTPETSLGLILRMKDITDNVLPSSNSVMLDNLLALNRITGDPYYKDIALSIPYAMPSTIASSPASCCSMLYSLLEHAIIN